MVAAWLAALADFRHGATTAIEWAGATWNGWIGCMYCSAGCKGCFAVPHSARAHSGDGVIERSPAGVLVWTGRVVRASDAKFHEPARRKRPTVYFVDSLSDFFYDGAKFGQERDLDKWRREMIAIMRAHPRHIFLILTKRPELIAEMLKRIGVSRLPDNVALGVSVENADNLWRIDELRKIPVRLRFLSIEPLIGDLGDKLDLTGIGWVIVGGESGSLADVRPMRLEWVRAIRDQCVREGVPFFFKQWGRAEFNPLAAGCPAGESVEAYVAARDPAKHGGDLLDGRQWHEMPMTGKQRMTRRT